MAEQLDSQIIPTEINQIIYLFYDPVMYIILLMITLQKYMHLIFIYINKQWITHQDRPNVLLREELIYTAISKSIWCSTADKTSYNESESGMLEYDTQLNKITTIAEYPQDIILKAHVCCQYKNKIYLIDGIHGFIVEFNIDEKIFTKKIDIPKVGGFPSAVAIFYTKII